MKISQANELATFLNTLMQTKGIVGFKIARNLRMINDELVEYNSIRNDLFRKYGEEQDGKLVISKFSDNYKKFIQEIEPYDNQEVEFNFRMITEDELANSDLTAEQMYILADYMVGEL